MRAKVLAVAVLLGLCASALSASPAPAACNIEAFGAVGDNKTEATAAIQTALRQCSVVVVPSGGVFLTRPVQILSHTHLVVEEGAVISAWHDIASWPNSTNKVCAASPYEVPEPDVEAQLESLLWASNATNITISGGGMIEGYGWNWWPLRKKSEYWHNCRPKLVEFLNVTDWAMTDVVVANSPFWTITGRSIVGATFDKVSVFTTGCGYDEAPNTDGFNLAGENIVISRCRVRNGDDCVPIFPPSRNVTVTDLYCECGNGLVTANWPFLSVPGHGGLIEDIRFSKVLLNGTATGAVIKSLPSFVGTIQNVTYENIRMVDVGEGVMINVYGQGNLAGLESTQRLGLTTVGDITVRNVSGTAKSAGKIVCAPNLPCQNLDISDVVFAKSTPSYTCQNAFGRHQGDSPDPCLQSD